MAQEFNMGVTFLGTQAGQTVYTHLEYGANSNITGIDMGTLLAQIAGDIWAYWKTLVSFRYLLLEIQVDVIQVDPYPDYLGYSLSVNEAGDVLTDALPPNVTVRVIKHPDNSTITPVGSTPFRNGRISFSGIPETAQENGLLTPSAQSAWEALLPALINIDVPYSGGVLGTDMILERGTFSPVKAEVHDLAVSPKMGTQNTRKR